MKKNHESSGKRPRKPKPARVREPVQVYVEGPDRKRLERLTAELGTTKSDVLRRGLAALERELLDPSRHPALRIIGLADGETDRGDVRDAAREHDAVLADREDRRLKGRP